MNIDGNILDFSLQLATRCETVNKEVSWVSMDDINNWLW